MQNTAFTILKPAGFWRRFWAYWIDRIVLLAIALSVSAGNYFIIQQTATEGPGWPFNRLPIPHTTDGLSPAAPAWFEIYVLAFIYYMFTYWIYFAVLESSAWQSTLGEKALGIMVTDLYGQRISFALATGRNFAKWITGWTFCIGYLMILWTPRKQALHDKISGCLVVRKN